MSHARGVVAAATRPARILEITPYPPPRQGWGVRVEYLKKLLESGGHECVVLNIGNSRLVPSPEYETVLGGRDFVKKVLRFGRHGFTSHIHVNGATQKGLVLALVAAVASLVFGRRPFLTFHAGVEQIYFPRAKSRAMAPAFTLLFRMCRAIICNSPEVKTKIVEYGADPSRVHPIAAFSTQYLEHDDVPLSPALESFYERFPAVLFSYIRLRPLFYPVEVAEAFARLSAERPDVGLVLVGVSGHMEDDLLPRTLAVFDAHGLRDRVAIVDDMDHASFVTALRRSALYVRSHVSDGVCSSVMESLSLGVPVVASENGTRPPGVICYPARDVEALARTLGDTLDRRGEIVARLPRPEPEDTLREEADLLTGQSSAVPIQAG